MVHPSSGMVWWCIHHLGWCGGASIICGDVVWWCGYASITCCGGCSISNIIFLLGTDTPVHVQTHTHKQTYSYACIAARLETSTHHVNFNSSSPPQKHHHQPPNHTHTPPPPTTHPQPHQPSLHELNASRRKSKCNQTLQLN